MNQFDSKRSGPSRSPEILRLAEIAGCAILLVAAVWFVFADLGDSAFHDGDEALYASIAREMDRSNDWLTPRYWGEPFLNKPPLQYWLMGLSYATLPGTSEFQARFPSAVAALLLIALVYWSARHLSGSLAGFMAALVLLTNVQLLFEHAARSAVFDSLVTTLSFAALVFGIRSRAGRRNRIASGVFLSGVMLLKAPIALFPMAVVGAHLAVADRRAAVSWLGWVVGSFVVLVLPWHIYELVTQGRAFWDAYVVYEIFGRGGGAVTDYAGARFVHVQAFWQSFLPWSPLVVAALGLALAGVPRRSGEPLGPEEQSSPGETRGPRAGERHGDSLRPLAVYALLFALVLSFLPSKWPWYGLPAYPALAVVFAVSLRRAFDTRWFAALPGAIALVVAARVLAFDMNPLYAPVARRSYLWPGKTSLLWVADALPRWSEFAVAAGVLAIGALIPLVRRERRAAGAAAIAAALSGFFVSGATLSEVPRKHESPARQLAADLERRRPDELFLIGFRHVEWYGDRMDPLSSVYFLGLDSVRVVDCRADAGCIAPAPGKRTGVVAHTSVFEIADEREAFTRRFQELGIPCDVWVLDPEEAGGYRLISGQGRGE